MCKALISFTVTNKLMSRTYIYITAAIALLDGLLLWLGLQFMFIPPIFKMARIHSPFLYYQGHILIALAVLLAWFRDWAISRLIWCLQEMHRWISGLLMAGVIGIEGFLHLFNIPHMEGWWLSMLGGSAFFGATASWLHKWKKKS